MSAGFTPGPWDFDGPPDSRIVWAGTEHRVCFLTSDGPNLANATLIAAAPAMFEALQEIASLCHSETRQRLLAIAESALSKARGDSSIATLGAEFGADRAGRATPRAEKSSRPFGDHHGESK